MIEQGSFLRSLWVEGGLAGVLVVCALLITVAVIRRFWYGQGHDINMAADAGKHYQEIIVTLQAQLTFSNQQAASTMADYKKFVHESIVSRLNHCEEQHKQSEQRLREAHQRLDSSNDQILELAARLESFKTSIATAAIAGPAKAPI